MATDDPPKRPRLRADSADAELAALRARLEDIERTSDDLVAQDVEALLREVVDRSARDLGLPCLLVADGPDGPASYLVASAGLDLSVARDVAERLAVEEDPGRPLVVVEVASTRRAHGHLAAVLDVPSARGTTPPAVDREVLETSARQAAAALDLTVNRRAHGAVGRVETLLTFAQDLAATDDVDTVARLTCAAMRDVVGCRGATVMLWDTGAGALRPVAVSVGGDDPHALDHMLSVTVDVDQTPELASLITRREPAMIRSGEVSAGLATMLRAGGTETLIAVPLLAGDTLMGVATASWGVCPPDQESPEPPEEVFARITGVSGLAATALHKVHLQDQLRHQSQHDALTGLPNRAHFVRMLDDALRGAESGQTTALLFCDLDRFKRVNDRLGHAAGDELLRQAAARIRGQLRPGDVVARLGSDEFVVLLAGDVEGEEQAMTVAYRLVTALDAMFRIDGREVRMTSSVGVAVHTGPDGRGERLLSAADAAMQEAKVRGRDQVVLAGAVDQARVVPSLEAELAGAVGAGQLRLYFQPVISLAPGGGQIVVGAEALLRWAHPRLGLLAPGAFLPLAEEAGLVTDLDLWALGAACEALASWPQDCDPLRVAVNLASSTLVDDRLLPTVRIELSRHGLEPDRLHLEVVESRSLADLPGVIESLAELRQMGVRISLDDFGTGFSTLSWLQALPVDQIKIDRSFIMGLPAEGTPVALVRGVLALARELGIEVIAEGVEEPEQLALLRDLGCEMVQGYLLGRPGPVLDTEGSRTRARELLRDGGEQPAVVNG